MPRMRRFVEVAAVGGGSPTRYACSTQSATGVPADWDHYERSRWEDRRQGGDERVMQLITAYRALLVPGQAAEAEKGGARGSHQQPPRVPGSAKAAAMKLLPARTMCSRRFRDGRWYFGVLLPSGQCVGAGGNAGAAWNEALAWAERNVTRSRSEQRGAEQGDADVGYGVRYQAARARQMR